MLRITLLSILLIAGILSASGQDTSTVFHFRHLGQTRYAFTEPQARHLMRVTLDLRVTLEEREWALRQLRLSKAIMNASDSIIKIQEKELSHSNSIILQKDKQIDNVRLQAQSWKQRFKSQRRQKWLIIIGGVAAGVGVAYLLSK